MIRAGREDHRHTHARRQRRDAELGLRPGRTDQPGLDGWGEATLEWKTRAVAGAVEDLAPLVIGRDPRDIEQLVRVLTKHSFWRLGVIGMSADLAASRWRCRDIFGKSLGVPVWRLLGGRARDRVPVYTHLGLGEMTRGLREPRRGAAWSSGRARWSSAATGRSRSCSSPTPTTRPARARSTRSARCMGAMRERGRRGGRDHGRLPRPAAARRRRRCSISRRSRRSGRCSSRSRCRRARPWGWPRSRRKTAVPIATGERLVDRREFDELFRARAVDIAQPDLCHVGGFGEARKIAAMAEVAELRGGAAQPARARSPAWRRCISTSRRPTS